ncbi:PucR family transcriptional regulator ligand-binding domain-containing protein [Streptosporangium sp. NPDC023615]|uniref:PucR family transcriptional regulator ligand-binding domain-containing protein n=1 Tax=Streptosporangium sp. NPDC023615 TaxID=3154794 RepID=UPI0034455A54
MRLSALLEMTGLGLSLVTGRDEPDPALRWVVTTDLLDPGRYLRGGELVLTGLVWRQDPADSETFVGCLAAAGVSALGAGDPGRDELPPDLVRACLRHRIPLLHVPPALSFAELTEQVVRRLSAGRASDITAVLDRHRRLVAGVTAGAGLDPVLRLVGHDLGMPCWVLTPAGRVVAGSHPLDEGTAPLLARGFLAAERLPCVPPGAERYSVLAVDEQATPRVADWFLAFEGSWRDWAPERRALAAELAAVVALERARLDDRLTPEGRTTQELVGLVLSGGRPDDFLPRLRVTGLLSERGYVAVSATARGGLRPGELRVVVKEVLHRMCAFPAVGVAGSAEPFGGAGDAWSPGEAGTRGGGGAGGGGGDGRGTTGPGDEIIALLPAPGPGGAAEGAGGTDVTAEVREAVRALAPGLGAGRISVGVSGVVPVEGLRGAVEEARHARRMAEDRPQPDAVVGHDELASHLLLLASVPDDVRRVFRARLLDPLHDYDRAHRADLVGTLETFLRVSGSWTRCAEILHVHVNTLRYRVQRIEELTGRDLSGLEDRVDFFLALRLG